jgi:hypothetical protein
MKTKLVILAFVLAAAALIFAAGCNKAELQKARADLTSVKGEKNACEAKVIDLVKAQAETEKVKSELAAKLQAVTTERDQLKAAAEAAKAAAEQPKKEEVKKGKKKGK